MLKSTIIRVIAFSALFAYIMPAAFSLTGFGSSFEFTGNVLSALAVGVLYMAAMFVVLAAWAVGMSPFKLSSDQRVKMWPITTASFAGATMLCLLGANLLPFLGLTVTGWFAALLTGGISTGVMYLTMPGEPRSPGAKSDSAKSAS
jgi:hypothetical protein